MSPDDRIYVLPKSERPILALSHRIYKYGVDVLLVLLVSHRGDSGVLYLTIPIFAFANRRPLNLVLA